MKLTQEIYTLESPKTTFTQRVFINQMTCKARNGTKKRQYSRQQSIVVRGGQIDF